MQEIIPGIHTWSVFSQERGIRFNGYAVETHEGTVLVDPVEPTEEGWGALDQLVPFEGVYVTNRNHSRAADRIRGRYGVPVLIHEADAERAEVDADETLGGGEVIGSEVALVHVPGKSPGEIAFHVTSARAVIVGDLVVGEPAGGLSTYPESVLDDPAELRRSAAKLLELDFDALLLCDGEPLVTGGRDALARFLQPG